MKNTIYCSLRLGFFFVEQKFTFIKSVRKNKNKKRYLKNFVPFLNKSKFFSFLQLHFRNACPVKEEVVAPFWANNTRGEVLALLNLYPFEQYVHWEKCTHEHKQMYCREGCRCEQQYRLHRLLAYDPHNECRGIFSDWFRFPSCCICKCYDIPMDFRATSRSPRSERKPDYTHSIKSAEEDVQKAIYEHATEEWYRPKDDFNTYESLSVDYSN